MVFQPDNKNAVDRLENGELFIKCVRWESLISYFIYCFSKFTGVIKQLVILQHAGVVKQKRQI